MGVKDIKRIAVKAIAMLAMTAVVAGIGSAYVDPVDVEADTKYDTLYDVFKARSGKGDDFTSQEDFRKQVLNNCKRLDKIAYTSGNQENCLACDGYVSLVFRLMISQPQLIPAFASITELTFLLHPKCSCIVQPRLAYSRAKKSMRSVLYAVSSSVVNLASGADNFFASTSSEVMLRSLPYQMYSVP